MLWKRSLLQCVDAKYLGVVKPLHNCVQPNAGREDERICRSIDTYVVASYEMTCSNPVTLPRVPLLLRCLRLSQRVPPQILSSDDLITSNDPYCSLKADDRRRL